MGFAIHCAGRLHTQNHNRLVMVCQEKRCVRRGSFETCGRLRLLLPGGILCDRMLMRSAVWLRFW